MSVSSLVYAGHGNSSVLVLDTSSNTAEYVHNGEQVRPIASITKLMTAMIALDYDKNLDRKLLLSNRVHSSLPVQEYSRRELLTAMLVRSDNAAAETIAEDYPGGRSEFVKRMNMQAKLWNMNSTAFADPSGLSVFNVSTVYDVADMINTASSYWFIRETSTKKDISIEARGKKKPRVVNLNNTNQPVLTMFNNIVIGKTGLTNAAGWCISLLVAQQNKNYAIIVLGSKNKNERTTTVKDIMHNHVLNSKT